MAVAALELSLLRAHLPSTGRCSFRRHTLEQPPPSGALRATTRSSSPRRQVLSAPLRARAPSVARWSCRRRPHPADDCHFLPRPSPAIARRCRRPRRLMLCVDLEAISTCTT